MKRYATMLSEFAGVVPAFRTFSKVRNQPINCTEYTSISISSGCCDSNCNIDNSLQSSK
ncbi:BnaC09g14090D [Brassica napus]|uniref:Uncharacterized protein n=2 Tax=Brassica TaxID=3705 RepID=A0A3P6E5Y2_BRAOL|nr:unnamed protein product [Brassica napus]CDY46995.1 BnaC09g14090D [Brassica napus]VDD29735.1 unnamed protein product [Brassica oleracea]